MEIVLWNILQILKRLYELTVLFGFCLLENILFNKDLKELINLYSFFEHIIHTKNEADNTNKFILKYKDMYTAKAYQSPNNKEEFWDLVDII